MKLTFVISITEALELHEIYIPPPIPSVVQSLKLTELALLPLIETVPFPVTLT